MNIIIELTISVILGLCIVFVADMIEFNWRFYKFKKAKKNQNK